MIPHHIGCIVSDIDEAVAEHRKLHDGNIGPKILVSTQKVWVCFAELSPGFFIEFVQQAEEGSAVDILKKKSITYYHIGYKTENIADKILELQREGFRLMSQFNSEAFDGKQCAFLFGSDGRLVELIEE